MAIAGAACAVCGGAKATAASAAQIAARQATCADGKRWRVQKALEKMRFTARDCITACMTVAVSTGFGRSPCGFDPVEAVKSVAAPGSRPLILGRNCGIGPGHGVAAICAD
jgi:methionine synthase I (cobalamin-dependent)